MWKINVELEWANKSFNSNLVTNFNTFYNRLEWRGLKKKKKTFPYRIGRRIRINFYSARSTRASPMWRWPAVEWTRRVFKRTKHYSFQTYVFTLPPIRTTRRRFKKVLRELGGLPTACRRRLTFIDKISNTYVSKKQKKQNGIIYFFMPFTTTRTPRRSIRNRVSYT